MVKGQSSRFGCKSFRFASTPLSDREALTKKISTPLNLRIYGNQQINLL